MTTEQFTYWLQGYSEVCGKTPSKEQWVIIQDHLKEVFHKVTPDRTLKLGADLPFDGGKYCGGIIDLTKPVQMTTC